MKVCFKCKQLLPLDCFYKHSQMKDGHLNKCKECAKKDTSNNYIQKIDYYRDYEKGRASLPHRVAARKAYGQTEQGKKAVARAHKKWNENNAEIRKAHSMVRTALKKGHLIKRPCEMCGSANVEAHHPDYFEPLYVVWLCSKHHHDLHKHQSTF